MGRATFEVTAASMANLAGLLKEKGRSLGGEWVKGTRLGVIFGTKGIFNVTLPETNIAPENGCPFGNRNLTGANC